MKKTYRICLFLLLFLCSVQGIWAKKSFSVQMIQKNCPETAFNVTYLLEQSLLDYFYEQGYIVSNTQLIVQPKDTDVSKALDKAYDEAQEGYFDYQVLVSVVMNIEDSENPEAALLSNISKVEWEVISLKDGKSLYKGYAIPPKVSSYDDDSVINFARDVAVGLQKVIDIKGGKK